MPEAQKVANHT